jgi:geranylgeranyl pyrophosphate synthase
MERGNSRVWDRTLASAERLSRSEDVLNFLERFMDGLPIPERHRELLQLHLGEGRAQAERQSLRAAELPLLVHAALAGSEEPALPLAAACVLVYLGADLLDNVADAELPPCWLGRDPGEATLAAATLLAALPTLVLEGAAVSPQLARRLQLLFAEGMLAMSAGQQEDIAQPARWDAARCRTMVERKGGAEFAFFCRSAATLAGKDEATVSELAAFGAAYGAAGQLASDVGDLWLAEGGRDVAARKRTLPIVYAHEELPARDRVRFEQLLEAADAAADPLAEIRGLLKQTRSLERSALVVEVYVQRALRALREVGPLEPAGTELRALTSELSLLRASSQ